ncbi:MAG: hypothetical protein ACRCU5_15555 [Rhizobiaceae bacterium]
MSAKAKVQKTISENEAFKPRSPERDLQNDDERIERLDNLLQDVIAEVRSERKGLRERYENSSDSKVRPLDMRAWSMGSSQASDESELALAQCVARLKKLEAQDNILQQMQQDLARVQGLTVE